MPKYKVGIYRFAGSGWECSGCVSWLMNLMVTLTRQTFERDTQLAAVSNTCYARETPITMIRNRAVKHALDSGADYILMVDDDVIPDYIAGAPSFWVVAWEFMMRQRADEQARPCAIAAPYCGPPPSEQPYIFKWKDSETDSPDPKFRLELFEREEAAFKTGIERVPALPAGLILFDARMFQDDLLVPWFDYEMTDRYGTAKASTEDVYFTRNASILGYPMYVAWDCWAMHLKDKYVRKPNPITADQVHESLVKAVVRTEPFKERTLKVLTDELKIVTAAGLGSEGGFTPDASGNYCATCGFIKARCAC